MGIKNSFCSLLVSLLLISNSAIAAGKNVEVLAGQELLIYAKTGVSINSFASSASQQMTAFGSQANLKFVSPKVAVAAFGASGNSPRIVPEADILSACNKIKNEQVGCEVNRVLKSSKIANDNYYSSLSGLVKISAPSAWDISTGAKSVKVAIVDTGVDYTHPDLAGNIAINSGEIAGNGIDDDSNGKVDDYYGYDFANLDSNPMDDNSHGTHVAGTIGAVGNNSVGVVGVNWEVGLLPVKVLSASGSGTTAGVIAGIDYAVSRGAKIINMSLGGAGYSQSFYDSIQRANAAGVLVVAAAGNESNDNDGSNPSYPASFNLPNIISVAATTSSDTKASFSNYGATSVHLAAPGVSILSTLPGSTYGAYSGTSMATPHVAGAAALVKAANPGLSMLQVKDLLLNNVDVLSSLSGLVSTSGRLNVAKAVAVATGTTPAPPTPEPTPTQPPADGGGDGTAPGDGSPEEPSVLSYLDVDSSVNGRKASILVAASDQDYYGIEGVGVTVSCANKTVGEKTTNVYGEVKFSYKLKSASVKCVATAVDTDGVTTLRKGFRLRLPSLRRH